MCNAVAELGLQGLKHQDRMLFAPGWLLTQETLVTFQRWELEQVVTDGLNSRVLMIASGEDLSQAGDGGI